MDCEGLLVRNKLCCMFITTYRCGHTTRCPRIRQSSPAAPLRASLTEKLSLFTRTKGRNLPPCLLPSSRLLPATSQPTCASDLSGLLCRASLPSRGSWPRASRAAVFCSELLHWRHRRSWEARWPPWCARTEETETLGAFPCPPRGRSARTREGNGAGRERAPLSPSPCANRQRSEKSHKIWSSQLYGM